MRDTETFAFMFVLVYVGIPQLSVIVWPACHHYLRLQGNILLTRQGFSISGACPGVSLELRGSPAFASRVLGLKACAINQNKKPAAGFCPPWKKWPHCSPQAWCLALMSSLRRQYQWLKTQLLPRLSSLALGLTILCL